MEYSDSCVLSDNSQLKLKTHTNSLCYSTLADLICVLSVLYLPANYSGKSE